MLNGEQRDVISYGLSVLTSNILGIAGVLFIAYMWGAFISTLALLITLLLLRPNAGGAHCSNSFNCSLIGYVLLPLLGYGAFWFSSFPLSIQRIYIVACACLGLTGIFTRAPYFTQSKPRAEIRSKKLKTRALIIAMISLVVALIFNIIARHEWAMGIATGLLFQGLVLLPPGIKVIQYLDNYLLEQFIKIKKEVN
jgi:accessory gene regulator protein AgrB